MPQSLWAGLRAGNARCCHDFDDTSIGGFAAPRPELFPDLAVADAVHQVERIEERLRRGHSAVDTEAALFSALEGDGLRREVHPVGGERQGFRGAATGIEQRMAIGADVPGAFSAALRKASRSEAVR